jgi:osmotically-inducible protein OsmY
VNRTANPPKRLRGGNRLARNYMLKGEPMRILFPSLLALAFLGVSACSNSGSVTSAATTKDADLKQTIKSKLNVNPALQQINVSADASRNLVTLSGSVVSEQARTEAVAMAKSAGDNLTIVDKIEVRPQDLPRGAYTGDMARDAREKAKAVGDKLGASLDDAWIYTKIEAKLAGNSDAPLRKINVDVSSGVVTLRGQVASATVKQQVEDSARATEGVKEVNDLLTVGG